MKIDINDIKKMAKSSWGTKGRDDCIDLIIDKIEEIEENQKEIEDRLAALVPGWR